MMIMGDKKNQGSVVANIIDKLNSHSSDSNESNDKMESSESNDRMKQEFEHAASKIMQAVRADDANLMAHSLKDFIILCMKEKGSNNSNY